MNNTISLKIKYVVLFVVVLFGLVYVQFFTQGPEDKIETKTTTITKIIEKVDSASVDLSENKTTKTIPYLVDTVTNKVRKQPAKKDTDFQPKKATEKKVVAQVFKETFFLENAKVEATIVSPERIFNLDLKVFTKDKIVTTKIDTKITKYVAKNVLFLNVAPKFAILPLPAFVGAEVSVDYTINNKFRLGLVQSIILFYQPQIKCFSILK